MMGEIPRKRDLFLFHQIKGRERGQWEERAANLHSSRETTKLRCLQYLPKKQDAVGASQSNNTVLIQIQTVIFPR